jgi:peptidoglycan/xylan/chitin deacetylase (PgdA/CDA1 family)
MLADEVVALAARPGHTVGAHTVNHLHLPSQAPDVVADELSRAKSDLEALLGRPVTALAYPFGAVDAATRAAAAAAGFTTAVGVAGGLCGASCDLLHVPRWNVTRALPDFATALDAMFRGDVK